jgi:hypothetical protein
MMLGKFFFFVLVEGGSGERDGLTVRIVIRGLAWSRRRGCRVCGRR